MVKESGAVTGEIGHCIVEGRPVHGSSSSDVHWLYLGRASLLKGPYLDSFRRLFRFPPFRRVSLDLGRLIKKG